MSLELGFHLHPSAAEDFLDIWEFIANDNPLAAQRLREEIVAAIVQLISFPHLGHKRPDLTHRPLRFHRVREYLIVYAPDESLFSSSQFFMEDAIRIPCGRFSSKGSN